MPNVSAAIYVAKSLDRSEVAGRSVLDVGSCNYNGSVAPLISSWKPAEYLGVDVVEGPGVDQVCSGEELCARFGEERFDVVLCVEVLEHAREWRTVVSNLKRVLRPGGLLVVTTRSYGFPVHGFPHDFWRFEREDFAAIFDDLECRTLECDPLEPGVFFAGRKGAQFKERGLDEIALYSVLTNSRVAVIPAEVQRHPYYRKLAVKQKLKHAAHEGMLGAGRLVSRVLGVATRR